MGISASYNLLQLQTGVQNRPEMNKYCQLLKEAREKFGNNFTPEHDKICAILAKDPNATIEDVEKMYTQVQEQGVVGNKDTTNAQRLNVFYTKLKTVPGYNEANLTSENLRELLQIYNSSYKAPRSGMTGEATFFAEATKYIEDLDKNSININTDNREKINENMKQVGFEYSALLNKSMINRSK